MKAKEFDAFTSLVDRVIAVAYVECPSITLDAADHGRDKDIGVRVSVAMGIG